jgi:dissimilatory sulfite reductase (desulfoviridin) alpha/beta subunit
MMLQTMSLRMMHLSGCCSSCHRVRDAVDAGFIGPAEIPFAASSWPA